MARQRRSPEQIIRLLKQADVLASQGKTVEMVCREIGVSDATYYKWRKGVVRLNQTILKSTLTH